LENGIHQQRWGDGDFFAATVEKGNVPFSFLSLFSLARRAAAGRLACY